MYIVNFLKLIDIFIKVIIQNEIFLLRIFKINYLHDN